VASPSAEPAVTLRLATTGDAAALRRLAELDTRPLPPGPHLVAELWGSIEAAICLRSGEIVANPFIRTAELCELLWLRTASLAKGREGSDPSGARGPMARPIGAQA
jgi:hypothetical protein